MGVAARHRKHKHKMIFPSLLLALVTAAQAGNIAEELTKAGATTLVDLVVKAGLAETLSTSGPFTVFAPDNDAFARLGDSVLETLGSDVELLKKVLLYPWCQATSTARMLRITLSWIACRGLLSW